MAITPATLRADAFTKILPPRPTSQIKQHPITIITPSRRYTATHAASGSASTPSSDPLQTPTTTGDVADSTPTPTNPSLGARIKRFFTGEKMDRERLKALGLGAVASYGMLSNLVYCTGAVQYVIYAVGLAVSLTHNRYHENEDQIPTSDITTYHHNIPPQHAHRHGSHVGYICQATRSEPPCCRTMGGIPCILCRILDHQQLVRGFVRGLGLLDILGG